MSIKNVLVNMFKPGYFPVMINKVIKRLKEPKPSVAKEQAGAWCEKMAESTFDFVSQFDKALYQESLAYNQTLQEHGASVISNLPVKMGAGGNCVLLYFLARYLKPSVIVETGVSMGFSSHAFLTAIQKNGNGHLYSSDFPYFRLPDPEKYIGCVVESSLKENWTLAIEGDHNNLSMFRQTIQHIDLFHYDSDKSYAGRNEALNILNTAINRNSTVVFDDIGDNFHFRDWVNQHNLRYKVLHNPNGGYVGITGKILDLAK